jgi:hypothetical protein
MIAKPLALASLVNDAEVRTLPRPILRTTINSCINGFMKPSVSNWTHPKPRHLHTNCILWHSRSLRSGYIGGPGSMIDGHTPASLVDREVPSVGIGRVEGSCNEICVDRYIESPRTAAHRARPPCKLLTLNTPRWLQCGLQRTD